MNYYEKELKMSLKNMFSSGDIIDAGDSKLIFKRLSQYYPVIGSKLEWERLPDFITRTEYNEDMRIISFVDFFKCVISENKLSGNAIYVGDGLTNFALKGSLDAMKIAIFDIISIPQHHYFIDEEYRWCFCFTMEGDMEFGVSSPKYFHH